MFKLATFLILSTAALALDLADGIQSGDFWKQKAQTSLQGVRCSRPDAEHLRTSGLQFGELTTGEVIRFSIGQNFLCYKENYNLF